MIYHMYDRLWQREKELQAREIKERVRLSTAAASQSRARLQEEHTNRVKDRREGSLQRYNRKAGYHSGHHLGRREGGWRINLWSLCLVLGM